MNNKKGYTLIEILIAMGILAIMAIPILDMYSNSLKVNIMSDNQIQSDMLAQKYMEFYKSNPLPIDAISTISDEGFDIQIEYNELDTDLKSDNSSINTLSLSSSPTEAFEIFYNSQDDIILRTTSILNDNLNVTDYNFGLMVESDGFATDTYKISYLYNVFGQPSMTKMNISTKQVVSPNPIVLTLTQNTNLAAVSSSAVNIDVFNFTDKDLQVYLSGSVLNDVKVRVGENSDIVKIYRNLTTSSGSTTNDIKSYEINIIVSKAGTIYTNLRSVIGK